MSAKKIENLRTAAKKGDAQAQNELGWAYFHGEGVAVDKEESMRWHRKAAEQGHAPSQYAFAVAHIYDAMPRVNEVSEVESTLEPWTGNTLKATDWLQKAAEQGYVHAQWELGMAYSKGAGFLPADSYQAAYWWREAAEQGHVEVQFHLGCAYGDGDGMRRRKPRKAVRWLRKAAKQGHVDAQETLGRVYEHGVGVEEDEEKAMRWFRKAAEQGHVSSQSRMGFAYWDGYGVIMDKREAYIWWSIAKANNYEPAAENLREKDWHTHLSQSDILSAEEEATRRGEEFNRCKQEKFAQRQKEARQKGLPIR